MYCCIIVLQLRNITTSTVCGYSIQSNKRWTKTALSHIILSLKVEPHLIRRRQVVPAVWSTNQPFGFKCCCLRMASAPRGSEERDRGKTRKRDKDRASHPRSPSDSACCFPRLPQTLLVGRGWQQAWGVRRLQSALWFRHIRWCVFVP